MKALSLFLLLVGISYSVSESSEEDSDPYLYDEATFEEATENQAHFVMFFAPWCGHCKNMKPTWKELSDYYNEQKRGAVTIAKVDCTVETKLCSDNGVTGYPTLKLFKPGEEAVRFRGGREFQYLKNFVEESIAPAKEEEKVAVDVTDGLYDLTADNFGEHVASGYHFIKFYAPWCGHCKRLEPVWKELGVKFEDGKILKIGRVDCTKHQDVCKTNEVKGYPTLLWFKDGDMVEKYQGGRQLEAFLQYIAKMTGKPIPGMVEPGKEKGDDAEIPSAGLHELTATSYDQATADGDVFVMFYAPWCGHCKKLAPTWKQLAEHYKDNSEVKIARVDCTKHAAICEANGVRGYPTLKYLREGKAVDGQPSGRDLDSLKSFVGGMLGGIQDEEGEEQEAQQEEEKAEPEAANSVDGLYELTDDNYEALTSTGDFFIKFFAPWCGHCKRMEPAWKELAKTYESDPKIKIGRVDCTKYSSVCGDQGVRGYPTLKYFRDGNALEGSPPGRDIDSLKSFVVKMSAPQEEEQDEEEQKEEEVEEEEEKAAEEAEVVEGLYELTEQNFKQVTSSGDFFIKFFAPWCGHCKRMEPAWKELAKAYDADKKVNIARVDCTKHSSVCTSNGVRGYPTLKYFRNGEAIDGSPAGRDIGSLKEFIAKMTGAQVEEEQQEEEELQEEEGDEGPEVEEGLYILTEATFKDVIESGDSFVKFFAPWCGHCKRMEPAWKELAKAYESDEKVKIAEVDCTAHGSVCTSNGVRGYPTLKYFKDGKIQDDSPPGRDIDSLKSFVARMSTGSQKEEKEVEQEPEKEPEPEEVLDGLYELTEDNFDELVSGSDFFVKFFAPWCGHCKAMEPAWKELAKAYEGHSAVKIGRVDCTKHRPVCQSHGARGYPTLKYFHKGVAAYGAPNGRDIDSLKDFVEEKLEEGREQDLDEAKVGGAVLFDEDTFEEAVEGGIAFVMFYAPWCESCKTVAAVWDKLAEEPFDSIATIVTFGKIDCVKHEDFCNDLKIEGYPLLQLYIDGEPIRYRESRTFKEVEMFLINKANAAGYGTEGSEEQQQQKDEL